MLGLRYLPGVVTLELDVEKCIGCGRCAEVCPHAVFAVVDGKARMVDRDGCMECGACARNCSAEAIAVNAGVGCATAILAGARAGSQPACCERSDEQSRACCD